MSAAAEGPATTAAPDSTVRPWHPKFHKCCAACYPDAYPGIKGVCGAELLGIPPVAGTTLCEECQKVWLEHIATCRGPRRDGL